METDKLLSSLAHQLDRQLMESLLAEFLDIERRYVLGDWEPATLNGGQLAEITSRLIYHVDSGNLNRRKDVNACLMYIEDGNNNNPHHFPHRRSALHLVKVLRTLYKFRSQRGAVHIDPDYSANELDSSLVISLARWIVSELLRIFWCSDTKTVATVIREIVRYEVPAIISIDSRSLVLHTGCSVEEEVLLLLHNAGEAGMSRREIGESIPKSAPAVTRAIQSLFSAARREVIQRTDKMYVLTPNGTKRIHNELADKLTLA